MSTNFAPLTLMEETQLWLDWAIGDHIKDVGKHTNLFTAGWALRDAALMDLALRGRVQMKRFKPLSRHSRYRRSAISRLIRGVFCLLWFCLLIIDELFLYGIHSFWRFFIQQAGGAGSLYYLLGFPSRWLSQRRLVLVDATPTGDAVLDSEMQARFLTDGTTKLQVWFANKVSVNSDDPFDTIEQRLVEKGALTPRPAGANQARKTKEVVYRVDEASAVWQALCRRLQAVLLGTAAPDAQTLALLLLITFGDLNTFTKRPKTTAPVLTLVSREERAEARQRLTQMLLGDQSLAAQVGETLYDTLLGIRDNRV